MRPKIIIGLLCIAAVLVWTGVAYAQTAAPAPKMQLPSGETVWDLSGDWDALIENYGPGARHGTGTNVYRLTQTGITFHAIRTNDDPLLTKEVAEHGHAPWGRAGSPSLQGEAEGTDLAGVGYSFVIDDTQLGTDPEFIVHWGNGRVGIGRTNPVSALDVNGTVTASAPWVSVDVPSGTLANGASASITASLNSAANARPGRTSQIRAVPSSDATQVL